MKIAIYGSRRQHAYREALQSLLRRLVLEGVDLDVDIKLYDHLEHELGVPTSGMHRVAECPADADLVLSIGGDGTFLRTAAWAARLEIPILGINTGHLGFLSALTLEEAVAKVDDIVAKRFRVEARTRIEVNHPAVTGCPLALNEVVVSKEDSASMISATISVDGNTLGDYRADGVILSTPTGSTAYNLSVGGPIVQPQAPVFILSPIAAHSLSLRPLVVADNSEIKMAVHGRGHTFRLTLDGRAYSLPLGSEVVLRKACCPVAIMQRPDMSFADVINSKLM